MSIRRLIVQVRELEALAERKKNEGLHAAARNAMREAQDTWTPELDIPKPDFSSEGWQKLDILEVEQLAGLAEIYRIDRYYQLALSIMHQAQDLWTPAMGIPQPDFSSEGWRDLYMEQMEQMTFLAEQNALAGWESEAIAALGEACVAWDRLPEPRPPRPRISRCGWRIITGGLHEYWTPVHSYIREDGVFKCPICLQDLYGMRYEHTICRNAFCCKCLDTWMVRSTTCPMCRQDL